MTEQQTGSIIELDDLAHTEHAHEFVGAEHGDVLFGQLRLTAIHGARRFDTEWLAGRDPVWTSKPKE
jgi:hypothetical protein